METERLYRLSIPGIIMLGSYLFFYLLFKGPFEYINSLFNEGNIEFIIAIVITAPSLGIIISTISIGLINLKGHSFYLNNPNEQIIRKVLVFHDDIKLKEKLTNPKINKTTLRSFYIRYQSHFGNNANEETIKFLQRRWNFVWIQVNNICAIILGAVIGIITASSIKKIKTSFEINNYILLFVLILLISYCYFAFRQIKFLRKEILEIEERAILMTKK